MRRLGDGSVVLTRSLHKVLQQKHLATGAVENSGVEHIAFLEDLPSELTE